jgi:hypothetical protein
MLNEFAYVSGDSTGCSLHRQHIGQLQITA